MNSIRAHHWIQRSPYFPVSNFTQSQTYNERNHFPFVDVCARLEGVIKLEEITSEHNILFMFETEHSVQLPSLSYYSHAKRYKVLHAKRCKVLLGLYDSIANKIVNGCWLYFILKLIFVIKSSKLQPLFAVFHMVVHITTLFSFKVCHYFHKFRGSIPS